MSDGFGGVFDCRLEVANLIDQVHRQGFLAGPDPAVGDGLDVSFFGVAPVGDRLHELAVHIVDQRLHVGALGGSHLTGGVAGVFEFADLEDFRLELQPSA